MENSNHLELENQKLREEISKLQKELSSKKFLIDHLPCMVSWVTKDLKYISVNKNLEEFLGITSESIHNLNVGELFDKKDEFSKFIKNFFNSIESDSQKEINSSVNNEDRSFYIRAQKYNEGNEAIIIGFDITDKKQIENQLQHNDKIKAIAQLATSIVHEIKNPLMVIKGNCELLETIYDEIDDNKKISMINKIHSTSDRIFNIIEGLKNLARDDFNDQLAPTKLLKILDETFMMLKSTLAMKNILFSFTNNINDPEIMINCIEGQIIQILVNLITNSIEEMPKYDEKKIEVITSINGSEIQIKVVDSGLPIEKKILEKIFTPYYTTKPKGVGTGLGLSICLSLAKKNNAKIEYETYNQHPSFNLIIQKI